MEQPKDVTFETVQEYSKKRRLLQKRKTYNRSMYGIVVQNILSIASHGYSTYIHPIDRNMYRDDEISYTKWKLVAAGFEINHRGNPTSWEHFFAKLFGRPREFLIVDWSWDTPKNQKLYQWE